MEKKNHEPQLLPKYLGEGQELRCLNYKYITKGSPFAQIRMQTKKKKKKLALFNSSGCNPQLSNVTSNFPVFSQLGLVKASPQEENGLFVPLYWQGQKGHKDTKRWISSA